MGGVSEVFVVVCVVPLDAKNTVHDFFRRVAFFGGDVVPVTRARHEVRYTLVRANRVGRRVIALDRAGACCEGLCVRCSAWCWEGAGHSKKFQGDRTCGRGPEWSCQCGWYVDMCVTCVLSGMIVLGRSAKGLMADNGVSGGGDHHCVVAAVVDGTFEPLARPALRNGYVADCFAIIAFVGVVVIDSHREVKLLVPRLLVLDHGKLALFRACLCAFGVEQFS